ncbi:MAG: transcriptional regulator [Clostridia bacterium]|jgi:AcrR family transcriptional regulator|nr:transcriptional regulator [Clostridia bacterium]
MSLEHYEKLKEDKKNKIYVSAINEFAQYGYNDANTIRIALESDIAKGSLFNYFGSKKGCFLYILNKAVDKILFQIKTKLEKLDSKDLFECITFMLNAKLALYRELPLEMNFIITAFSEKSEEIKEKLNETTLRYTQENERLRYKIFIEALRMLNLRGDISIDKVYTIMIGILDIYTMKVLKEYKSDIPSFFNNPEPVLVELKDYLDIIKYGILKA